MELSFHLYLFVYALENDYTEFIIIYTTIFTAYVRDHAGNGILIQAFIDIVQCAETCVCEKKC